MNVKEIVKQYLTEHGYDGLAGINCEWLFGCTIEDLMDCGCVNPDCTPVEIIAEHPEEHQQAIEAYADF